MKNKNLVVRVSEEDVKLISETYQKYIKKEGTEIINKSEFIRILIKLGIKNMRV